jgi:hypothetical protein
MSLAAAKTDLVQIFASAPSFNFDEVIAGDLAGMEKALSSYEAEAAKWRSGTVQLFQDAVKKIEAATAGVPKTVADETIVEWTLAVLKIVEEAIPAFSVPLHHANPDIAAKLDLIAAVSRNSAKTVRRIFRGIERIRVAQHGALVDLYYAVLAFQSEHLHDAKGGEAFSDPERLRVFLRQHVIS